MPNPATITPIIPVTPIDVTIDPTVTDKAATQRVDVPAGATVLRVEPVVESAEFLAKLDLICANSSAAFAFSTSAVASWTLARYVEESICATTCPLVTGEL